MTNSQILKDRIKNQCDKQEKSMTVMLSELSLGVNAVNQINEKKGMGAFALSKIADYLNCSVDYLLGRTDNPDIISVSMNGNQQKNKYGNNSISFFSTAESTKEINAIFNELTPRERTELMMMIYQFYDEHEKIRKGEN